MRFVIIFLLLFVFGACTNLEDAEPASRNTFVRFFEGPYSMTAASVEVMSDGYVVLANMAVNTADTSYTATVIFRTDKNGNRLGDFNYNRGGTGKSIKPLNENNPLAGYVIVGDRIKTNPGAISENIIIASARLLIVDENFTPVDSISLSDESNAPIKADYFGGSVTVTADGRVFFLGTYKEGLTNQLTNPEKTFVVSLNNDFTERWTHPFELLDLNYQNAKSIHYNNQNELIWASGVLEVQGDFTNSYIGISSVLDDEEGAGYQDQSYLGQNTEQLFIPKDIQPAKNSIGYGVVGTFSQQTNGSGSNIFFLRTNVNGKIIEGSARFFDAVLSEENIAVDNTASSVIDEGEALTATSDGGFVLAGSMLTTPQKGNGARDIYLIKIDFQGNPVWSKTMGGTGDEVVSTIREDNDGNLIICGTNTLGAYSSVFLMKTDKNGDLKN